MANQPISMIKIRRIIQLLSNGKNKSEIATELGINRRTVYHYLTLIEQSDKSLPELLLLSDQTLKEIFLKSKPVLEDSRQIHFHEQMDNFLHELNRTGVTLLILWQEYKAAYPDGYGYSQFCFHFSNYKTRFSATMHLTHTPGEILEVDFAGAKLAYTHPLTKELIYCSVLVCTLPYSGYSYVEALEDATQERLFLALNRCLRFLGGVPQNIRSDNMKQFVTKNSRYEYTFPELAQQWALHYNTSLDATRPRKPKDKATVENNVSIAYRRIYAKLRNEQFDSLNELNNRVSELLDGYNQIAFQKKQGSRTELFLANEKSTLRPLPQDDFTVKHRVMAKVQKNYHIILGEDNHQYSVPYTHIGKTVAVVYDVFEVEIFIDLERIAIHQRSSKSAGYTTLAEHMPTSHQRYNETRGWDEDFFKAYAKSIGPNTYAVICMLLNSRYFVAQSFKACLGIKRLGQSYGSERLESACKRALRGKSTYGSVKNILEKNLDKEAIESEWEELDLNSHENIRGEQAYH